MDDNVEVVEHQSPAEEMTTDDEGRGEREEGRRYDRFRAERPARERPDDGQDLRDELFAYLDLKFDQQREENEGLKRKLKKQESSQTKFSQKGHEIQFKFNLSVMDKLDDLEALTKKSRRSKVREEQIEVLAEVRMMLNKRNKLIKIADRSELGWKTVREYESDEIADDSADEKRLKAAEKAAAAKEKQEKTQKERNSGRVQSRATIRQHPYSSSTITRRSVTGRSSPTHDQTGSSSSRAGEATASRGTHNTQGSTSRLRSGGSDGYRQGSASAARPCFECGGTDHWRRDCPYRA